MGLAQKRTRHIDAVHATASVVSMDYANNAPSMHKPLQACVTCGLSARIVSHTLQALHVSRIPARILKGAD